MVAVIRPRWYLTRENGTCVPLIAADELPTDVQIDAIPRTIPSNQVYDMTYLGTAPHEGTYVSAQPGPEPVDDGIHPSRRSIHTAEARPAETARSARNTQSLEDEFIQDCREDNFREQLLRERAQQSRRSGRKVFCSYWLRTGECNWMQEGCRYLHQMPNMKKLEQLGFRGVPRWWLEDRYLRDVGPGMSRPTPRSRVEREQLVPFGDVPDDVFFEPLQPSRGDEYSMSDPYSTSYARSPIRSRGSLSDEVGRNRSADTVIRARDYQNGNRDRRRDSTPDLIDFDEPERNRRPIDTDYDGRMSNYTTARESPFHSRSRSSFGYDGQSDRAPRRISASHRSSPVKHRHGARNTHNRRGTQGRRQPFKAQVKRETRRPADQKRQSVCQDRKIYTRKPISYDEHYKGHAAKAALMEQAISFNDDGRRELMPDSRPATRMTGTTTVTNCKVDETSRLTVSVMDCDMLMLEDGEVHDYGRSARVTELGDLKEE